MAVLRACVIDLVFFGVVFMNCILAFSFCLYEAIGHVVDAYYDSFASLISLVRALFGDFDVDEVFNNSSGYLNVILLLGYLFVAVFIVLSMFLAILAEAQSAVRDDEQAVKLADPEFTEYGVCETIPMTIFRYIKMGLVVIGVMKPPAGDGGDGKA